MRKIFLTLLVLANLPLLLHANGDAVISYSASIRSCNPVLLKVSDIILWNGYHKSASLWSANSRIERLRLEVTRADGYKDEPLEIDFTGGIRGMAETVPAGRTKSPRMPIRLPLSVLEVVPGTKYKDLCLSGLSVLDGFVILDQ
ncbi:MAG: hypothetical protein K5849_02975 [Bacteroidales bacterium]|nr:hypothetical protein [Bacteroidales bacterium]